MSVLVVAARGLSAFSRLLPCTAGSGRVMSDSSLVLVAKGGSSDLYAYGINGTY